MIYFFAVIFAVISIVHLAACFQGNTQLSAATKPLLMPLLMATAIIILMPYRESARPVLLRISCALAAGTVGDIFLLSKNRMCFLAGAAAFLVGHLFWISSYITAFRLLPWYGIAAGILVYAVFIFAAYRMTGRQKGAVGIGIICYAVVLCTLDFTGFAALAAYHTTAAALYVTGATLFLASDSILGYETFRKPFTHSQFWVMLTYIAAQTLLTAGNILPVLR